jgi:hypothetical protein
MPDPEVQRQPSAPSKPPTVRQQWICVAVLTAIIMGFMGFAANDAMSRPPSGNSALFPVLAGLFAMFGNAMWITMDRRRRGLEIGPWRFATIFLGPAVICVYLVLEYKERSLFFLPLVVLTYAVAFIFPVFAVALLRQIWA